MTGTMPGAGTGAGADAHIRPPRERPDHIVVMGVSGCGKSTVAADLARRTGRRFLEGDMLHPEANRRAMAAGIALTDADRAPWLAAIVAELDARHGAGERTALSCSALRRAYRDTLRGAAGRLLFIHLVVPPAELARRLAHRSGHFMPAGLLASQLAALEPLDADELGLALDATRPPADLVAAIRRAAGEFGRNEGN